MQIGIFSDVHDQLSNLKKVLQKFEERKITTLIFCGDFCSPIPLGVMAEFPGGIHAVFGNNDGDRFTMQNKVSRQFTNIHLHGEYGVLDLESSKVAFTHYPFYGYALAKSGDFNAVFAGHTHKSELVYFSESLYMNPGDILGLFDSPSYGIYDVNEGQGEIISLF